MARSSGLRHGIVSVIYALATAATAVAQTLAFTEPAANAITALGATLNYTSGDDVQVAWQTDFEHTTLELWQGPLDDGSYVSNVLAANYTRDQTSYTWRAAEVDGVSLSRPFYFELSTNHDGDASCENCTADSLTFYVSRAPTTSSSSSASATRSSTSATSIASSKSSSSFSTSSSPTGGLSGAAATSIATSDPTEAANRHKSNLAVGLGVGLGLGIPLLLAIIGLLAFCLHRQRKRRRAASLPRGQQPNMSQIRNSEHQPLAPKFPQVAYYGGYRPGGNRSSAGTTTSIASSYHGPFPFEGHDSQDFETKSVMSEMDRHSLRPGDALSSRGSGSMRTSTPRNGEARLASIDEDMPPDMPPEWPLRS